MSFATERLDDQEQLAAIDRSGMLRALAGAGAQIRRAVLAAREAGIPDPGTGDRPRGVVIAAMGADDLVADAAGTLAAGMSPISVVHARNAPLPGWVGPLDLVVAVSLSGAAPGPLRLALEAGRRGASVVGISVPDSPLAQATAAARGIHVPVEGTGRHSRAAAWALLSATVVALEGYDVLSGISSGLEAAADRLDTVAAESRPSSEAFVNPAKLLAADLAGTIPLVLGDGPLTGVAARRAGLMLARTARTPAMTGELPDAAAALLACLDGPFASQAGVDGGRDIFADPYLDAPRTEPALLVLRDVLPDAPEVPDEADVARHGLAQTVVDLAADRGTVVREVTPSAGPDLARLAELIARVDYTATYLAFGLGLDPATAPALSALAR
ncbi:MAG: SIS domain-containing protein [Tetrasphaera sp.]